jgi:predicted alpha/beta superfamily hydrolase
MPQLDRQRRLWIYLPPGYGSGTESYPVLYMHDGQNLFSGKTSFSGEWGVDETLERMIKRNKLEKIIVVGIDNDPEFRLSEYSPFPFEYSGRLFQPQASEYAAFIVETLKPFIDSTYRTKAGREFTAVAGSSMGGLVSLYIGLQYQHVFSKVGAISSSFGICKEDLIRFINKQSKKYPMRFWIDTGTEESEIMEEKDYQIPVKNALISAGWRRGSEVKFRVFRGAEHNERHWRARLDKVLKFLYRKK